MDFFKKNQNYNSYYNILDFENTNEKKCAELDKLNEKIYRKLLVKATQAEKTIKNTGLYMNIEVPTPPHPSNRDKYIIWKKRNSKKSVIEQSEAILFLKENGYVYNQDYEAYQAINLANQIKKEKGIDINYKDNTKNFENVYNENDKNLLRKKSMYKHNTSQPVLNNFNNQVRHHQDSNQDLNNYTFQNQNIRQSTYNYLGKQDMSYLAPPIRKQSLPQISPIAIPMLNTPQFAFSKFNNQPMNTFSTTSNI